jgi:ABC-type lipoprotein release transport system permease subunit
VPDFRDWSERSRAVPRMGLYSTLPSDLVLGTYAAVALGLCAIGLLATYVPARRAASIDPMGTLRHE